MNIEDNHNLLIEVLSNLSSLRTRLDSISESNDRLSNRLEGVEKELSSRMVEIERSYHKTIGAIQFAGVVAGISVGLLTITLNLWVEQKIRDYRNSEIIPKTQNFDYEKKQLPK